MSLETIRALPNPKATPAISLDFAPHKDIYTYIVGEVAQEWSNTFYAYVGEPVTFTATIVWPTGLSATGYRWEFGDGSEGSGNPSAHTYTQSSVNINVALTVTDSAGQEWTARKTMYLKESPGLPSLIGSSASAAQKHEMTLTRPTGTISGDMMFAFVWFEGVSTTLSIPGWTAYSTASVTTGELQHYKLTTFTRFDTGVGGSYPVAGVNETEESGALVISLRGVSTILNGPTKVISATSTELTGPSITTVNANEVAIQFIADVNAPSSGPTGTKIEGGKNYAYFELKGTPGTVTPVYKFASATRGVLQTLRLV